MKLEYDSELENLQLQRLIFQLQDQNLGLLLVLQWVNITKYQFIIYRTIQTSTTFDDRYKKRQ